MNYQSGAALGQAGFMDGRHIPISADWHRVKYALAGYGWVVPGTISDPATATIEHSTQASCIITHSVTGA